MNLLLDMKTIFITLVCGNFFTVFLISAYWQQHKHNKTLNTFFAAKCIQAIAWLFLTIRGGIPDIFSISLANSLLFVGLSLEIASVLLLLQVFSKRVKKFYIYLTLINLIGFHIIILFYNLENVRIAFASIGSAIVIILPTYKLLFQQSSTPLKKVLGTLYFLILFSLIFRGISALNDQAMGLFTPSITQSLSFLSLYLSMILGNIGFILLLKERADEELIKLSKYDDLTNALNRRSFIEQSKQYLIHYQKIQKPVSLLLFDLDHFKQINDQHGHEVGDRVLKDIASHIFQQMTQDGLFGRYGGDEFAILLPNTDENQSSIFAEKMLNSKKVYTLEEMSVEYSLSIGVITVVPTENISMESLYVICDKALYDSKNAGRNKVSRRYYETLEAIG
ncbi:GGDEF domain-containing protein [Metabacillus litoralis]|nr:GGDEF domain-containing protein [Metabacillus litoralis]